MSVGPNNGFSVILGIASLRHSTDTVRPKSMLSPLTETFTVLGYSSQKHTCRKERWKKLDNLELIDLAFFFFN